MDQVETSLSNQNQKAVVFERTRIFGVRHLQVILLFLCLTVNFLMRVNLSVAIVLMTDIQSESDYKVFNWTLAEQSEAQSIFYFGYFILNIFAIVMVNMLSNKLVLLVSASLSSAVCFVIPTAVDVGGLQALFVCRVSLGAIQGMMMANVMSLMSRWIPPTERSQCGSLIIGGMNFGALVSFSTSGWIGSSFGWPNIFYFSGCLGIIWVLIWAIFAADSPEQCWFISIQEKKLIANSLLLPHSTSKNTCKIPFKKILSNKSCVALMLTAVLHYWGNNTLLVEMPTYFKSVLHLPSFENGMVCAVPFACMMTSSLIFSFIVDFLIRKKYVSVTIARKSCNTIGQWGVAVCLLLISYYKNVTIVLALYTTAVTLLGFAYFGFNINHLDIVPRYAGFFMGVTNALSTVTSLLGPLFAGYVVRDSENIYQWRTVFCVSAAVWFVANTIFLAFGSGDVQNFEDDSINEDVE